MLACKCAKHVEQIISAINHSVASSWFYSLRLYNDSRTYIHERELSRLTSEIKSVGFTFRLLHTDRAPYALDRKPRTVESQAGRRSEEMNHGPSNSQFNTKKDVWIRRTN